MVVIWGNILSFIGNVVALAVEVLVFDAFFPHNENRKKRWLMFSIVVRHCYILLSILLAQNSDIHSKCCKKIALNISVMCFFISKPLGSTLLYRRNGIFCFILL